MWYAGMALLSALFSALASTAQHRAASTSPRDTGLGLGLLRRLVQRPMWLAGIGISIVALALHAVALTGGALVVVQPLLVSGLLFALPASVLLERARPRPREWAWAGVVVLGLSAFLLAARPSAGIALADQSELGIGCLVTMLLAIAAVALGTTVARRHRGALLGLACGLSFGAVAALLKQILGLASLGIGDLLGNWALYALLLIGGFALVLTPLAYQAGRLAASLPPMTIADPLASMTLGVTCFSERLSGSPLALAGAVVGFVVMTIGVVRLAALTAHPVAPL
jgi:drug/metabolite transporter (DMT)-like permease